MSIRRLPEHLVNRIAAGEVVERPASALKELVENAIDAGSTRIAIKLAGGGTDLVEVTDDGCGMTPADMALALERHATSKLPDEAIENVATLGFRGEALPSIASVARMTLESRVRGSEGWARVIDNGEVVSDGPAAIPPGTRVRVEALFERVPARRKFLRSARGEYAACLDVVKRLAMARPDIGFSVEHDGRRSLGVTGGESLPDRVAALTDRGLIDNGVGVDFEREGIVLGGIAGLPTFNRGVADHQYLFVNGRPVKDRLLIGAIRGAYAEMIPRDRHAVVALFLDVPSDAVDVNVHPAKTEVRFREPALVRGLIVSGLRRALDGAGHRSQRVPETAMAGWTSENVSPSPSGEGLGVGSLRAFYGRYEAWPHPNPVPGRSGSQPDLNSPGGYSPGTPEGEGLALIQRSYALNDRRTFFTPPPQARAEPAYAPPPETIDYPLGVARGQVAKTYIVAEAHGRPDPGRSACRTRTPRARTHA